MRRRPPLIPLLLCAGACLLGLLALLRWGGAGRGLAGEGRSGAADDGVDARAALESVENALPRPEAAPSESRASATGIAPGADSLAPVEDARIDGLVLQPDGQPAALARVQFAQVRRDRLPEDQVEDSTVTDERGLFTINPAPLGPLRLVAMHDLFAPSAPSELQLQPGERKRELRLELREYGRIRGLVLDAHNVARAKIAVTCEDMRSRKALFGDSDAAGRFEFARVSAGTHFVSLKPAEPELADLRADAPFLANLLQNGDQGEFVEVRPGETLEVVLGGIPAGGVRVHGRVRSGEAPLARTWIWAESEDHDWSRAPRTRTDELGRYELWLAARGPCQFHLIGAGGLLDLTRDVEITEPHEQALDFDLPGASVSGRVVDSAGRPLVEVNVSLQAQEPLEPGFGLWMPHGKVDADGRFAFRHLPAGRYELQANPLSKPDAQAPYAATRLTDLVLGPGEARAEIEIVLRPGCTIRGVVRGAGEGVAASLRVFAHDHSGLAQASSRADADGSFVLRGLQPGAYELRASGLGLCSPFCAVEARVERESEAELQVAPGAQLWIGVRAPAGERPPALELVVRERNCVVFQTSFEPTSGERVYAIVAPGLAQIEVRGGGWEGSERVSLESGKPSEVELLLHRAK